MSSQQGILQIRMDNSDTLYILTTEARHFKNKTYYAKPAHHNYFHITSIYTPY